ncbi:glycosyltransferase family 2 protein [bacterium]|nr:glycosyltransferase family 2 protein [bacterium]
MKVTLVIPTRDEIVGMRQIIPRIRPEWYDQVIVLDGGSTDGTVEFARERGFDVHIQRDHGLRLGYAEIYDKIQGDVVITFSPDGNSVPEVLPDVIAKLREGYDLVIASRYLPPARSYDDTALTRIGNYVFTKMIGWLFGYPYTDSLVIFRGYRKTVVRDLGILDRRSPFYEYWIGLYISWEPQLSIRAAKRGLRIAEVPGDEPVRVADDSKKSIFLPQTRISHFKSGLACLYLVIEERLRP